MNVSKNSNITTAVIVAAGLSTRLYPHTKNLPKCMLHVAGEPMLARSVRCLKQHGIENIFVVVGYHRQRIEETLGDTVRYIHNPFYAHCNNMGSFWCARPWVDGLPMLYLHGDLVYDPKLLAAVLAAPPSEVELLVDFGPVDQEAMKVRVENDRFVSSSKDIPIDEAIGEWTGIARFSGQGSHLVFEKLDELLGAQELQSYDTLAFTGLAKDEVAFGLTATNNQAWVEIDDADDLDRARRMFADQVVCGEGTVRG